MGRLRTGERVLLLHLGELVAEDDLGLTGAGANLLNGEGNLVVFVQAGPEKISDFVDVVLLDGHDHGIALEGGERLAVAHVSGHHQTFIYINIRREQNICGGCGLVGCGGGSGSGFNGWRQPC